MVLCSSHVAVTSLQFIDIGSWLLIFMLLCGCVVKIPERNELIDLFFVIFRFDVNHNWYARRTFLVYITKDNEELKMWL